jgi:hypothetical protein
MYAPVAFERAPNHPLSLSTTHSCGLCASRMTLPTILNHRQMGKSKLSTPPPLGLVAAAARHSGVIVCAV